MRSDPIFRVTLLLLPLVFAGAPSAVAQAPAGPAEPPARATAADFQALRWLAGNWKGEAAGQKAFYEGYRFADDSTLVMTYFADSTLTRSTGTGTVELRAGHIYHRSGNARWVVTRANSSELHFAPVERASNHFVWKRETAAAWTATLASPNRPVVVYRLTRIPD